MTPGTMFEQITDFANRADPYPLYAELRKTPVARQDDGSYLVSTYREILALLHDPRISSDLRNRTRYDADSEDAALPPTMIKIDPPEHDTLRRQAMRPFGPPHSPGRIEGMHTELAEISSGLIDGLTGRDRIDIVDDFAYPFPVTVICRVLGVPREDEPRFHVWAEALVEAIDPSPGEDSGERQRRSRQAAVEELLRYEPPIQLLPQRTPLSDIEIGESPFPRGRR